MKIRLTLDIDDEQRRIISSRLKGQPTKRLATRAEVRELLEGLLARYCSDEPPTHTSAPGLGSGYEQLARESVEAYEPARFEVFVSHDVVDDVTPTRKQLDAIAAFQPMGYALAGFVGLDVIIETSSEASRVRQRIQPDGTTHTCRSDSFAIIEGSRR